jgi:hypothetical protein
VLSEEQLLKVVMEMEKIIIRKKEGRVKRMEMMLNYEMLSKIRLYKKSLMFTGRI